MIQSLWSDKIEEHENKELDRLWGREILISQIVLPRASHTKLEKIMKELDEEVKCQLFFFFTAFCIIFQIGQ